MPSILSRKLKLLAALLMLPLLPAGCATMTGTAATDAVACSAFEPITWSQSDTDETIKEVKSHNAAWSAICKE